MLFTHVTPSYGGDAGVQNRSAVNDVICMQLLLDQRAIEARVDSVVATLSL